LSRHPSILVEVVRAALQQHVDEFAAARTDIAGRVPISVHAVTGQPGPVLCDAADAPRPADGRQHGHDSVAGALLGSVGLHCVLHARCPVTSSARAVAPGSINDSHAATTSSP
jgi:nucleotide-binding universal stress UspA family protein